MSELEAKALAEKINANSAWFARVSKEWAGWCVVAICYQYPRYLTSYNIWHPAQWVAIEAGA